MGRNGTSNLYPASPPKAKIRGNHRVQSQTPPIFLYRLDELKLPSGSAAPAQTESGRKLNSARFGHSLWSSTSHLSHPASELPILSSPSQCLNSPSARPSIGSESLSSCILCIRPSWRGHSALVAKKFSVVSPDQLAQHEHHCDTARR
jgi:hypothetical protein